MAYGGGMTSTDADDDVTVLPAGEGRIVRAAPVSSATLDAKLAKARAMQPAHPGRWFRLHTYERAGTARVAKHRLTAAHPDAEFGIKGKTIRVHFPDLDPTPTPEPE